MMTADDNIEQIIMVEKTKEKKTSHEKPYIANCLAKYFLVNK